jgi:hypothetical protein
MHAHGRVLAPSYAGIACFPRPPRRIGSISTLSDTYAYRASQSPPGAGPRGQVQALHLMQVTRDLPMAARCRLDRYSTLSTPRLPLRVILHLFFFASPCVSRAILPDTTAKKHAQHNGSVLDTDGRANQEQQ